MRRVRGIFRSNTVPSQQHSLQDTDTTCPIDTAANPLHRAQSAIERIKDSSVNEIIVRDSTFIVTDFITAGVTGFEEVIEEAESEPDDEEDADTDNDKINTAALHRRRRIALSTDLKSLEGEIQNMRSHIIGLRSVLKVRYEQLNERMKELRCSWDIKMQMPDVEEAWREAEEQEDEITRCERLRKELEMQARWVRLML